MKWSCRTGYHKSCPTTKWLRGHVLQQIIIHVLQEITFHVLKADCEICDVVFCVIALSCLPERPLTYSGEHGEVPWSCPARDHKS